MRRPVLTLVACLGLLLVAGCDDEKKEEGGNGQVESTQTTGGVTAGSEPGEQASSPSEPSGPTQSDAMTPAAGGVQQDQLASVIESARAELQEVDRSDAAALQAASESALATRRQAQCELFEGRPLAVEGWEGTVQGVHPLQDSLALQVAFAPNAFLMTSFGSGLDQQLGVQTAFREADPLHETVQALRQGDRIVVSGTFFESDEGCIFQIESMNPSEWIEYPTFLFRYETIEKQ